MTLEEFRGGLEQRGGEADVWLVYVELPATRVPGIMLDLQAAFWTRGEAYSSAWVRHDDSARQFYVFRLLADAVWAAQPHTFCR